VTSGVQTNCPARVPSSVGSVCTSVLEGAWVVERYPAESGDLDGPRAVEPSGSRPEQGGEHRFGVGEIWKEEVGAEATE
jgi:hypothetical protein